MRVAFLHSDKPRERLLADAFLLGASAHGHETVALPLGDESEVGDYEVAVMVGVKSRERFRAHRRAGRHVIYLDKGYSRHKLHGARVWEFWRVAIDAHQPTARLTGTDCPTDRMESAGWRAAKWRSQGRHILFAGSSEKYSAFYGLPHPTRYARSVVGDIRAVTDRPVTYRPKPSWRAAAPIRKAAFSKTPETLSEAMQGAHALVTHGSNACFEAVLAGIPCVVLGEAVALPISSSSLADIENPRMASPDERAQWLANLAYWQWTESEFASGEAWNFLGRQVHA